jgi:hypothetical protein
MRRANPGSGPNAAQIDNDSTVGGALEKAK